MKKSLVLYLIFLLFCQNIWAQKNVSGSYHISSGNPDDGGYTWFLLENNEFAMVTFGQIISGTWKIKEQNEVDFEPYAPTESFHVFARFNPTIKGTKIIFERLDINESLYFGTSNKEVQRLLNEEANCLPEPIIKTFNQKIEKLILSNLLIENTKSSTLNYDYEMLNNNDFIVVYYDSQNKIPPFKGEILNGKLTINHSESSSAKRNISSEDEHEIKQYIDEQKNYYAQDSFLSTIEYRFGDLKADGKIVFGRSEFNSSDYTVDPKTGTYQLKTPFSNEHQFDYNTLFLYKKLDFKITAEPIKVNQKSVFTFGCG